jgi:hypothetical protein
MQNPILHEHPNPTLAPVLEYSLPVAFGEVSHLGDRSIPEWFLRFDSLDSDGVLDILTNDWEKISSPVAKRIANALLQRSPRSILVDADDTWLRMDLPGHDYNTVGLRAPKVDSTLVQIISQDFQIPDFEAIYNNFSNLGEGILPYENSLWMSPQGATEESFPGCGVWAGALPIYYICNGDVILLSREGQTGRWLHEYCSRPESAGFTDGSCVQPVTASFDSFITLYLNYLSSSQADQKNSPLW